MLSCYAIKSLARAVRHGRGRTLDAALRERVILHVSAINACDICTSVHVRAARRVGLEDADIQAACTLDLGERDDRTRAALRYAEARTLDVEGDNPDVVARFETLFSDDERAAVRATVDLFTFNNRFNNTWQRLLGAARS
jgi:AhpD family alkylhydroperoxidase